jgi:hypothetical protein
MRFSSVVVILDGNEYGCEIDLRMNFIMNFITNFWRTFGELPNQIIIFAHELQITIKNQYVKRRRHTYFG